MFFLNEDRNKKGITRINHAFTIHMFVSIQLPSSNMLKTCRGKHVFFRLQLTLCVYYLRLFKIYSSQQMHELKPKIQKSFFKFKQSCIMHHIIRWESRHCLYKSSPTNKVKVKYKKICVVQY